jgi:hypothetical protein
MTQEHTLEWRTQMELLANIRLGLGQTLSIFGLLVSYEEKSFMMYAPHPINHWGTLAAFTNLTK